MIGPAADAAGALTLIETEPIDCTILDYRLPTGTSLPVADALLERGVPFLFASGYDASPLGPRYAQAPRLHKVYTPDELLKATAVPMGCDHPFMPEAPRVAPFLVA